MIKQPFNTPRRRTRIPTLRPAARPGDTLKSRHER